MVIEKIFSNNKTWAETKISNNANYFKNLSKGQSPEVLYIGCSDSRVVAEEMMGLAPGEVFVHRNIANMVCLDDLSAMSVVDYAVNHLKVKHIVVCGHYYCGGIKAAMGSDDLGVLNPWINKIRNVYELNNASLYSIQDEDEKYRKFIEINVFQQCENVKKIGDVNKAINERGLQIHGFVFDISTGNLIDLNYEY